MSRRSLGLRRWRRLRRVILERDSYRCRICRRWGGEVDHVVPVSRGGSEWDSANLQCLCSACHIEKTRRENRAGSPAQEAWRRQIGELVRFSVRVTPRGKRT